MVYRFDSLTAGTLTGYVNSASGNVVNVTFDSTFTPASDTWILSFAYADTATASTHQRLYATQASTSGRIDWNPDPNAAAFTFSSG